MSFGSHSLVCKKGSMRFHRHSIVNEVVRRAVPSAGISLVFEPSGLLSDGEGYITFIIKEPRGCRPEGESFLAFLPPNMADNLARFQQHPPVDYFRATAL
uniref:Uncharacterized protein n=1 Tax=Amphimedon queenslandica TaxID=400682 RepID=A0A1X7UPA0_AMPQE